MLQQLLGAEGEGDAKTYQLFPLILYPEGSTRGQDVFLNLALINVSDPIFRVLVFEDADWVQVLRVILFSCSSLENGRPSGPTPSGLKWGLTEVTAGTIALAAVIISPFSCRFLQYINSTCRFK